MIPLWSLAAGAEPQAECDALLGAAVKTPYGWGWRGGDAASSAAPARSPSRRGARPVNIDVRATARAGLTLHLAGQRTGAARYRDAALQAARAVAAVQASTGQFPATGVIGTNAGGKDEPAVVPAREATIAGLALLLVIVHDARVDDDPPATKVAPLRAAALKAAHWLSTQETREGGWPFAFMPPPDDAPARAGREPAPVRLIRLDDPGSRDATYVLWLAAHVLNDARLRKRAEAAVEELVALRIADEKSPGRGLWSAVYNLDATPATRAEAWGLPFDIDLVASRHAIQALLAATLLGDADATVPVLKEVSDALERLPHPGESWQRHYDLHPPKASASADPEPIGTLPPSELFEGAPKGGIAVESVVGIGELQTALQRLAESGAAAYRDALAVQVPVEHRVAMTVCGLRDDALTADLPRE
jgi:hypothetical protein